MATKDQFDFSSYKIVKTSTLTIPDNPNLFDHHECERIYPASELSDLNEWEAIEYKFLNGYSIAYGISYLTNNTKVFAPFLLKGGACIEGSGITILGNAQAFAHRASSRLNPSYEEYENDKTKRILRWSETDWFTTVIDLTSTPSNPSVCPNCGKPHGPNGECDNENCEDNPNIDPPTNPNDNPPTIWGYASEEIWDIEGRAGYSTPIFFRAFDDYGISKFAYCEIDEHETEGMQIIRYFKPEKVGDIAYRFNIFKELEGNYRYQIFAYDTANQKTESNVFNVTINPAITNPVEPPIPPSIIDSEHIILYDKKANDFTNNGIGVLDNDVIDYTVDKEENGVYELTLKYLITGKYTNELLDVENIIKCKTDISNNIAQLFRIYDSEYIMQDNMIIVKAQHISYDLKGALVENVNLIDVTCKQATQSLISRAIGNDKFIVNSDVETKANFSQQRVNVLEGIVGLEKSIFDTFGGDNLIIERDNFHYNINKKVENDKGIIIAYSKNLLGFKRNINSNDIVTGIYPYARLRNGAILKLKEKVIYSQYKDSYATSKIKAIDFTKETVVNEETLREEAQKYFNNGCDIPKLNYEVDFVSLYSNNLLLKDKFKSLEEVILGDTVIVQDSKIGISVKARVIRTVYNGIKKRYEKIELGNFKNEYRLSKKNEQDNIKRLVRGVID